ncbi:MAG: O-acetylhomoserine aminocarboxypropyltransferase/cysteine synthase [Verrucomicrobiaceae bacterium]|nr:O-acetylhomoserine aminocarboxypropyltransferase/cysteine synthase [Verrucomicrobiaceae bacterium]
MQNYKNLETIAVQSGYDPQNGQSRVPPIVQSTTYAYDDAQAMADLFDLKAVGHFYTRLSNPTVEFLEKKMAALEGGIGAMGTASGQSATSAVVMTLCNAGDHIVSTGTVYGGTSNLLGHSFEKLGIKTTFVDQTASEDEIFAAVQPNTKMIFAESLSNPSVKVLDFEKFSNVAKRAGIPFVVDNTFPTPFLCRPIDFGANIVVHSTSKYSDGHACALGGMVIDAGNFDFASSDKFPSFNTPDPTYHGLVYTKTFGNAAFIVKARTHVMRDFGMMMSPMNAWLTNMNLETLPLRMERHSQNAEKLAQFFSQHPNVDWVNYPSLPTSADRDLAKKYLKACSGVMTFGPKGGRQGAEKVMNKLKLAKIVTHVADTRTCVLHPASTTHRQLSDDEQRATGILPELIRVSVGIEHIDDIIADFSQALS